MKTDSLLEFLEQAVGLFALFLQKFVRQINVHVALTHAGRIQPDTIVCTKIVFPVDTELIFAFDFTHIATLKITYW